MRTLLIAIFLLSPGSAWATNDASKTVSDNRAISRAVREQLAPGMANAILNAEYDGFYQIRGKQKRGEYFRFNRVKNKKSYPDDRWEKLAIKLTEQANFKGGSNNVGSRTKASATAYVVFYKNGIEGIAKRGYSDSLALVMIKQKNVASKNMPTVKGLTASKLYLLDGGI